MELKEGMYDNVTPADFIEMKSRIDHDLRLLQEAQSTANQESEDGDIADVLVRLYSLQSQLVGESASRSWCELRLKRMEMGKLLCDKMSEEPKDTVHEAIVKNNLEKLDLASQIMRIKKETSDLQEKVDEQKESNFKLKSENTELMRRLTESKDKRPLRPEVTRNKDYKRLKSELEVQSQSTCICTNLIQRLVVGLGIDLNNDEELQRVVEKCGEPNKL